MTSHLISWVRVQSIIITGTNYYVKEENLTLLCSYSQNIVELLIIYYEISALNFAISSTFFV